MSTIENQSGLKKRRRNQGLHMGDTDEDSTSNGPVLFADGAESGPTRDDNDNEEKHDDSVLFPSQDPDSGDVESKDDATGNLRNQRVPSGNQSDRDDSDMFCWVCHKYGKVICCDTCVRVYHMRCLNLNTEPSDDWFCPECADIMLDAQRFSGGGVDGGDTPSTIQVTINKKELMLMLLHAIEMMRLVDSSEPFHEPVDTTDVKDYDSYIVNPMSLSKLEENVKVMRYSSVGGFMSDARWIVHNCIVYNGANNPLTAISRQILKRCRKEMQEISACPDCYLFHMEEYKLKGKSISVSDPNSFAKVCRVPHPIVWVRLRNYPEWPAKVIQEMQRRDEQWVRTKFFGAHDYAEVPFSCATFHAPIRSAVDPKTLQVEHFRAALDELTEHERRLKEKYPDFEFPSSQLTYLPELANNAFRLLGARKKRHVNATIRSEGGLDAGDNGVTGGGGLIGSRRSSNESVSSSVFAGGQGVHQYRAKQISEMKTRLVSVSIGGTTPQSNDNNSATVHSGTVPAPAASSDTKIQLAATTDLLPATETEKQNGAEATEEPSTFARNYNDSPPALRPVPIPEAIPSLAQTIRSAGRRLGVIDKSNRPSCNGADDAMDEDTGVSPDDNPMDTDESSAQPQSRRKTVDKATYTEDLDDVLTVIGGSNRRNVDLLDCKARDLLSLLRWYVQDSSPSKSRPTESSKTAESPTKSKLTLNKQDAPTSESLSSLDYEHIQSQALKSEEECNKLREENDHLRRWVNLLEQQQSSLKNKSARDLKALEDRLSLMYEVKLIEQRHNYELCLAEARHAHENDRVKIVNEVRRLLQEDVKKIVLEVKRKQWCAYCRNEAFYYCCWNTSYCDANCQKKHWTTHMQSCAQTNQQNNDGNRNQANRVPINQAGLNPQQQAAAHANQANMAAQIIPGRRMIPNVASVNQR